MRCADARQHLVAHPHPDSEDHLAGCQACSDWLEARDPLATAMRQARPSEVGVPSSLAGRVLRRWRAGSRPRLPWWRLIAATTLLVGLAAAVLAFLAADLLGRLADLAGSRLDTLGRATLLPGRLLLENPAWILVLVAATAAVCAAWLRLFNNLGSPPRAVTR
jgi:predicted anti-sigma-YlaC factor YlaD